MFGLLESSFVDYPGKICVVVFFPGCKLRCSFCHNPQLVLDEEACTADKEDLLKLLESRGHVLDGVCFSGGEPLLHAADLADLIPEIKSRGLLVKLDTNGYLPDELAELLHKQLVDYIAMDIKSSPIHYAAATGTPDLDFSRIERSAALIRGCGVDYEFRTTVVPDFFTADDALQVGEWLKGSKKYVLQQFSTRQTLLDPAFQNKQPYPPSKLRKFQRLLTPYFERVDVRGI